MNPGIENLRGYILRKEHHVLRRTPARLGLDNLNIGFAAAGMPPVRRSAEMLAALMRAEQPVILPGEKIVFTRTVTEVPEIFTPQEWDGIKASHYIHERGTVCNISDTPWLKEIAPSDELRRWFDHDPVKWPEFRRRYAAELDANPGPVAELRAMIARGPVTLLFAAHDAQHNNAVALRDYLAQ